MYSYSKRIELPDQMIACLDLFVGELEDKISSLVKQCEEKYKEYGDTEQNWTIEQKDTIDELVSEKPYIVYLKNIIEERLNNINLNSNNEFSRKKIRQSFQQDVGHSYIYFKQNLYSLYEQISVNHYISDLEDVFIHELKDKVIILARQFTNIFETHGNNKEDWTSELKHYFHDLDNEYKKIIYCINILTEKNNMLRIKTNELCIRYLQDLNIDYKLIPVNYRIKIIEIINEEDYSTEKFDYLGHWTIMQSNFNSI